MLDFPCRLSHTHSFFFSSHLLFSPITHPMSCMPTPAPVLSVPLCLTPSTQHEHVQSLRGGNFEDQVLVNNIADCNTDKNLACALGWNTCTRVNQECNGQCSWSGSKTDGECVVVSNRRPNRSPTRRPTRKVSPGPVMFFL